MDDLALKRDRKLEAEFLKLAPWTTGWDRAREESRRTGRPILAYFTLSHFTCLACAQLEGSLFQDDRFPPWAKDWVLFQHLTTGIPTDPHQDLHRALGGEGWPVLLFLDAEGRILSRVGARDLDGLRDAGQRALAFLKLMARADAQEPDALADLLLARLDLGTLSVEDLRIRSASLEGLSEAKRSALSGRLADEEVKEILKDIRLQAGDRFLRMKTEGRIPASPKEAWTYWNMMMESAEARRDAAAFSAALEAAKAGFQSDPNQKRVLGDWERKLRKWA